MVISVIGLSLMEVGINWAAGGVGNPDYGNPVYLGLSLLVLMLILLINKFAKGFLANISVLLGIDAAEIHHAQCDAERRLGQLTKHRLEALIRSGPVAFSPDPPAQRDKYGRLLVHLLVNGEDAACILIKEGYARPWRERRDLYPQGVAAGGRNA